MAEAMQYFSTKYTVRMNGMRYIPTVCYKLDETIAPTIAKLVEVGEAKMYPEKVRFVNGVPLPIKKPVAIQPEVVQPPASVKDASAAGNRHKNSGKKDFD